MSTTNGTRTVPERERPSWAFWLGCPEEAFDETGVKLIRNPRLDQSETIILLRTPGGTFISIPAGGYEHYEAKLASLAEKHLITLVDVINALGDDVKQLGYVVWQASLEPADFRPRPQAAVTKLVGHDLQMLKGLQDGSHPTEWDHSCLSYSSDCTYGVHQDGKVVAAAHYIFLRPGLASIGVLTDSGYRGAGYASAVVSAAVAQALGEGHNVHYQTLLENDSAIAVAEKLGFRPFGLRMLIKLKPRLPGTASLPALNT